MDPLPTHYVPLALLAGASWGLIGLALAYLTHSLLGRADARGSGMGR